MRYNYHVIVYELVEIILPNGINHLHVPEKIREFNFLSIKKSHE